VPTHYHIFFFLSLLIFCPFYLHALSTCTFFFRHFQTPLDQRNAPFDVKNNILTRIKKKIKRNKHFYLRSYVCGVCVCISKCLRASLWYTGLQELKIKIYKHMYLRSYVCMYVCVCARMSVY